MCVKGLESHKGGKWMTEFSFMLNYCFKPFKAWIAMIYVQLLTKILTSARHMASKSNFHHQPTSQSYETKKEPHWWKLLVHIIVPGLFYLYSVHTTGAMVGCCVQSETVLFTDLVIIFQFPSVQWLKLNWTCILFNMKWHNHR